MFGASGNLRGRVVSSKAPTRLEDVPGTKGRLPVGRIRGKYGISMLAVWGIPGDGSDRSCNC